MAGTINGNDCINVTQYPELLLYSMQVETRKGIIIELWSHTKIHVIFFNNVNVVRPNCYYFTLLFYDQEKYY